MRTEPSYRLYSELFQELYQELCNYAYTYLQDDAAAEDVVQETFTRLWQKHREMISAAHIRPYLFRAVRNNCISAIRSHQAGEAAGKSYEVVMDDSQEPNVFEKEQVKPHYEQLIYEAIANLPPQCREVFTCCKLKGMTHQQTATQLGLSAKTVENYMGRALKLLRKYLQQYGLPAILLLIKMFNIE